MGQSRVEEHRVHKELSVSRKGRKHKPDAQKYLTRFVGIGSEREKGGAS